MSIFEIVIYLFTGLILLVFGGEGLVRGSSSLALRFGISPLVIGLTIVAFGTSSPELLVSVQAVLNGNSDISLGNILGSNIGNIGLILGISAVIKPLTVQLQVIKKEIPFMIFATILISLIILFFSTFNIFHGIIFLGVLITYIFITIKKAKSESKTLVINPNENKKSNNVLISGLFILFGLIGLVIGSDLFVKGSTSIAKIFGVSDLVIGLTIVAIGTSLPELVTSVMAAIKNETDIAIGNVVGSNIFNILAILGTTGIMGEINLSSVNFVDISVFIFTALLLFPLSKSKFAIQRWEGALLLLIYLLYIFYLII